MEAQMDVRPSPIAGQWYPGDPKRLSASVNRYMDEAKLPPIEGEVVAIMAPHAGHIYSGPVAGYAFAAVRGLEPERVAVISPMHYPYFQALLTSAHSAYATPLGRIPIDLEAMKTLDANLKEEAGITLARIAHDPEHSLEIELPFLQCALPKGFQLLPVMVREQHAALSRRLGAALAKTLQGHPALLVASTDLSHFYPQEVANSLDQEFLRYVEAFDPDGVMQVEEEGKGFACGRAAVAAVLWAAKDLGANKVTLLHHATSGDVTGDFSQVVGYGAAVVTRTSEKI
jgi:AmmeMemoRadiSam system protein B